MDVFFENTSGALKYQNSLGRIIRKVVPSSQGRNRPEATRASIEHLLKRQVKRDDKERPPTLGYPEWGTRREILPPAVVVIFGLCGLSP